jgi:hypothetical protein
MEQFITLLEGSEYGVEIPYAGGYMAYVSRDEDRGGYSLSYCKGEMPPHATDHADTVEQAAAKMAEVVDLTRARPIEQD